MVQNRMKLEKQRTFAAAQREGQKDRDNGDPQSFQVMWWREVYSSRSANLQANARSTVH